LKKILIGAGLLLVGVLVVAGVWLSPRAKRGVIAALERKYDSRVEIRSLDVGFFPFPHARLEGLVLRKADDAQVIRIAKAEASASWFGALRTPKRVSHTKLEGLEIILARGRGDDGKGKPDERRGRTPFEIQELAADGTVLRILPKDPDKEPLVFDIYRLRMKSVGTEKPMQFDAQLRNAKPPGMIYSTGEFGPWNFDDARRTPVKGGYRFENADLGDLKGIAGKLSSTGEYAGLLERLEVRGTTDTPDFQVTRAANPVHLKTEFSATVDGTSGDTLLHPVVAHFGETTVTAEGGVTGTPGKKGKTVRLNTVVKDGNLGDVLQLGVKDRPPMRGRISFNSVLEIPPGDRDIMDKMKLDGQFSIESGKFTSAATQKKISGLSERAQGEPEGGGDSDVLTDMRGKFALADGVLTLDGLRFAVPGAKIQLGGTYGMRGGALDLSGTVTTEAKVSQMTTGWKSFLLKALDPVFQKNKAGAVIPIRIGGTRDEPSFGLRLRK
jgi:hypothetical protein